jgi:hypothetical protein
MFHSPFPICSEKVKAKTVDLRIDCACQLMSQHSPLRRVEQALKNGLLHPLSVVHAQLGNLPEPFSSLWGFRIDIVGD